MQYGYPPLRKYPLNTRVRVHAAIAHFAANQDVYPAGERREIARNIKAKARDLGIDVRAF